MKTYVYHLSYAYLIKKSDFPAGVFSADEKRRYIPAMEMRDAYTDSEKRLNKKTVIKDFTETMRAHGKRVTVYACDMFTVED